MNPIQIAKFAVSSTVGLGATKVISGIVQNNTNPQNVTDKVQIVGASYVLGWMVAEKTKEYTDAGIDKIVEIVKEIRNKETPTK